MAAAGLHEALFIVLVFPSSAPLRQALCGYNTEFYIYIRR